MSPARAADPARLHRRGPHHAAEPRTVRGLTTQIIRRPWKKRIVDDLDGGFGIQMFGHLSKGRAVHSNAHIAGTGNYVREGWENLVRTHCRGRELVAGRLRRDPACAACTKAALGATYLCVITVHSDPRRRSRPRPPHGRRAPGRSVGRHALMPGRRRCRAGALQYGATAGCVVVLAPMRAAAVLPLRAVRHVHPRRPRDRRPACCRSTASSPRPGHATSHAGSPPHPVPDGPVELRHGSRWGSSLCRAKPGPGNRSRASTRPVGSSARTTARKTRQTGSDAGEYLGVFGIAVADRRPPAARSGWFELASRSERRSRPSMSAIMASGGPSSTLLLSDVHPDQHEPARQAPATCQPGAITAGRGGNDRS